MATQKDKDPIKEIKNSAEQAARADVAPVHVRRYRAVLFRGTLLLFATTFAILTLLIKTMPLLAVDVQITRDIQLISLPSFATLMVWISWPGFGPQNVVIAVLIILIFLVYGYRWEAVMAALAGFFSGAVNYLVKILIQRPRPTSNVVNVFAVLNSYSFPSGHVMFYLVFFGFVGFLVFTLLKPSTKRSFMLAFISILIILIGISRIYLGEHWASDVLGAYLLGSLTLVGTGHLYIWGKTRFFVHQPVAASQPQQPEPVAGKFAQDSAVRSMDKKER